MSIAGLADIINSAPTPELRRHLLLTAAAKLLRPSEFAALADELLMQQYIEPPEG
jgi:hypothetical protein